MSAATRTILVAAAVSLALSVVGSSSARANGGPSSSTRLDRATASVLAQDLAFIDAADQSVDVERCIRIPGEPLRVDCVMEFGFDGPENANVYVIVITGERVSADVCSARLRSRNTKANSIQTSPAAFRPVLIQEFLPRHWLSV